MDVEALDPDAADVQELIALSDSFYVDLYPAESNHLVDSEELKQPNALLLGCRADGLPVACGAARIMDDDGTYAEIKRVFVVDSHRGKGLSKKIMQSLESRLQDRGIKLFRLETGVKQPEALGLYRKLGYRERGPFGAYRVDPLSVFMEKDLGAGS